MLVRSNTMIYQYKLKPSSISLLPAIIVIIQILTSHNHILKAQGAYGEANESSYHPEKQSDGPPMIAASASRNLVAPIYKWNSDDPNNENAQQASPAASRSIERRADRDPEEEFDDDDRDEDKSGSSQHGSFENPAFGESRRAAQDGEEIESFFDKHLGPPSDGAGSEGNSDVDSEKEMSRPIVNDRIDPDDGYETAASTPLSDIFHTLIKAHKRPFIITTSSGEDSNSASSTENQQKQPEEQSATPTAAAAAAVAGPSPMAPSASSPIGSAPNQQLVGPQPNQFMNSLRGTPFMDPTPFPIMAPTAMSPLAYFSPIAAPSNMNPYEPPPMSGEAAAGPGGNDEYGPNSNQGREIYIVRRPSVLQHIRAVAPPLQRLVQQSSNAHWRGVPLGSPLHQPMPMNHHHHHPFAPRPYPAEESPAASAEYHNYPIGAHSYSYQREQPHHREPSSDADDEPGTVSYGLSFGGHNHADADEPESNGGPSSEEQSSVDAPPAPPVPYHSGYGSSRSPVRFTSQSTRAYNNYNYAPQTNGAPYRGGQQSSPHYQHQQHQQHHYHGARYHKDPSESAAQPVNYAQYSPMQSGSNQGDYASWATRQQLLANLDKQIKNNQYYRQNTASAPSNQHPQRAPITVRRRFKTRLSKDDSDVDSFSSFHSEVDPYKSFTASSKLVNEPQSENTLQKGSHREPNDDMRQNSEDRRSQSGDRDTDKANNNEQDSKGDSGDQIAENSSRDQPKPNRNLMSGPVSSSSRSSGNVISQQQQKKQEGNGGSGSSSGSGDQSRGKSDQPNHRVRREDADDRENDEVDDDGVWVDDDEDDDNRQTASDLNETTQDPEEDENQQESNRSEHVPGVIGNPHGYELIRRR